MFKGFLRPGKASFVIGGQWGSEGKGAAAAHLARRIYEHGDCPPPYVATANAGAQAGHTSTHAGITHVVFHLPTVPLIAAHYGQTLESFVNAGAVIDPEVLHKEIRDLPDNVRNFVANNLTIHPNAAVITQDCKDAEGRADSAQTRIASTRKGVGEALARKVLRSGLIAKDCPALDRWVSPHYNPVTAALDYDNRSVLVEVPQGIDLSLNSWFYPHTTSRNCTVMQAMADAEIHPQRYGNTLLVLRTYPIRVGSIPVDGGDPNPNEAVHSSGAYYPDQKELTWADLGVKPEITTVTKRVRRVFTFSREQCWHAMKLTRPSHVQLTFCDYPGYKGYVRDICNYVLDCAKNFNMDPPTMVFQYGPTTDDCYPEIKE